MSEKNKPSNESGARGNAGDPSTTPRCGAVQNRVDRSPGAILDCRGQSNPTLPVPGRNEKIQPNKHREIQLMRPGRRKLFNRAAQEVFLEWFAATCNVKWSAELAGFNYKTVLRHRMTDAVFAEGWDRAVRQGYARLEAQQLETKAKEVPIGIEGDWDAPEMDPVDPELAMQLLREHKREAIGAGPGFGEPRKQGRRPHVATNAEVKAALLKSLKAFEGRVKARLSSATDKDAPRDGEGDQPAQPDIGGGDGPGMQIGSEVQSSAQGPLHRPADGPPPRPGEDQQ